MKAVFEQVVERHRGAARQLADVFVLEQTGNANLDGLLREAALCGLADGVREMATQDGIAAQPAVELLQIIAMEAFANRLGEIGQGGEA